MDDLSLVKPLGPRSARGRQPSGPRRQVRGDFACPRAQSWAARILKDRQPPLSRIDSNFLKRESVDSMNQALPGERVAAPARNIHLQNNSFPRSELSTNTLSSSPGTREAGGGAGLGRGWLTTVPTPYHCPGLQLPRPDLRWPWRFRVLQPCCCSQGTDPQGSLCRGLPRPGAQDPASPVPAREWGVGVTSASGGSRARK